MRTLIKRIFDTDIKLSESYYGYKIRSLLNAYGTSYDFCKLYTNEEGGTILTYNSTLIADGSFDESELDGFIEMLCPVTVEVSTNIRLDLSSDYIQTERTLFKAPKNLSCGEEIDVKHNAFMAECFPIISEAFGITEFDEWYVDISHKIRHGVSDIYIYKTTTVTKAFDINGFVFLSHIATASADRGQRNAARLIKWLCENYEKECKEVYLYSKKERYTFYQSLGFEPILTDIVYEIMKR